MSKLNVIKEDPWYKDGLKFTCTQCGKCCSGENGEVWLTDKDVDLLAKGLKISRQDFLDQYTSKVFDKILLNKKPNGDCIFLKNKKCTAHHSRPVQCRSFPYWPSALKSKETWEGLKNKCEGIEHKDAEVIPLDEITKNLNQVSDRNLNF
ncbi:MAG: YkgJ family cysteine cluster protein [Chlamydiota bacterium]|jgi:Fe-S-cluster containining protein